MNTVIGLLAAAFTTASYFPQLQKCWTTGKADDLSFRMLAILATGISLWVFYGVLQRDYVIIIANAASLAMLGGIIYFKARAK
jgi:MtN3 and saliva related transmembrane protein